MHITDLPTIVIVPGLRDHVVEHWQTLLADRLARLDRPVRTVEPPPVRAHRRAGRVAALDAVLQAIPGPVLLVAHSAGVITTVHWARRPTRPVAGALLATPADLELPLPAGHPSTAELDAAGWNPIPRRALPFPSILAASTNDPLARYRRVTGMAEAWGSRPVTLGPVGHLNPAAGYGPWPAAEHLIADLARTARDNAATAPARTA